MNKIKYSFSMFLKIFVKFYFSSVYDVNYIFKGFNPKRKGPFFLVGNHVILLDAFFSNFPIKGYAVPVASSFVYTNPLEKLGMTVAVDSIIKRKGQSDITTIRNIRRFISDGRSIAVYPEGNTSYYGDTTTSMYSTAKLFKMQKIDVIVAKTRGGYFAKPRWRDTRAKKPYVEIEFVTLFKGNDFKELSIEDIYNKMIDSYYQNDYEWNRIEKHKYLGKDRLKGIHRVIYGCPKCGSINKITSEGDSISCTVCGMKGTVNDYGFIKNTKYDNFVEWGKYQENLLRKNLNMEFDIDVDFYKIDWKNYKKIFIDKTTIKYSKGVFIIKGKSNNIIIEIKKIIGEAFTEGNQFSFDYNNETYFLITEKPKLLLDLTVFNKEE